MIPERARTIGRIQAAKAVTIGLILAYAIMSLGDDWGWLGSVPYMWPNLAVATGSMYLCAYVYGGWAGAAIVEKKRAAGWVGPVCGVWTLLTVAFLASWVGFCQEGLAKVGTDETPFFDYIYKPVVVVAVFGFLPAALVGLWFGYSIKHVAKQV